MFLAQARNRGELQQKKELQGQLLAANQCELHECNEQLYFVSSP